MSPKGLITLSRDGNRLRVDTSDATIREHLECLLTFKIFRQLMGWERRIAKASRVEELVACYNIDYQGRLCTSFGFYRTIAQYLQRLGYACRIQPFEHPKLVPQWDRLFGDSVRPLELRYRQDDFLVKIASRVERWLPGRFDCPPAFGKSFMIGLVAKLYPQAKVHVVTKRVPVLRDRIYPELCQMLPNVGLVGGGVKINNRRVQLYTVDSLNHSTYDADILMVDECFPAGTLVDGKPIETYKPGDMVWSVDEKTGVPSRRRVVRIFKNRLQRRPLLRVTTDNGTTLVSTLTHPVWTQHRGFIPAVQLQPGDVLQTQEYLYAKDRQCSLQRVQQAGDLCGTESVEPFSQRAALLSRQEMRSGDQSEDAKPQSGESVGGDAENRSHTHEERHVRAVGAGWQRHRTHTLREAAQESTRFGMEPDSNPDQTAERVWVSNELQAGPGVGTPQSGDRDRWSLALRQAEGAGSPEGDPVTFARVACVEVLESAGDGQPSDLCRDGYVYNLEVEETHTYFANGLLVHNCHEVAADDAAAQLAQYDRSVNFGLSATHDMRLDNKDFRNEALFGPIVFTMGYDEACRHGMVTPIEVYWRNVNMSYDPCEGQNDLSEKKRWGIWRNEHRNNMIAEDARQYFPNEQVLITTEVVEHALHLKKLLPEFEVVYSHNGVKPSDLRYFRGLGVWPEGETPMDLERRDRVTRAFEAGHCRGAIATTVWNVGVNFLGLGVVCRADAGGSGIMDTQIPGRISRLHDEKAVGKVRDYNDNFNTGFKQKSGRRRSNYVANGWKQIKLPH